MAGDSARSAAAWILHLRPAYVRAHDDRRSTGHDRHESRLRVDGWETERARRGCAGAATDTRVRLARAYRTMRPARSRVGTRAGVDLGGCDPHGDAGMARSERSEI